MRTSSNRDDAMRYEIIKVFVTCKYVSLIIVSSSWTATIIAVYLRSSTSGFNFFLLARKAGLFRQITTLEGKTAISGTNFFFWFAIQMYTDSIDSCQISMVEEPQ